MIRQVGNPTWFCSLSAAETRWKHLLQALGRIVKKKQYTDVEKGKHVFATGVKSNSERPCNMCLQLWSHGSTIYSWSAQKWFYAKRRNCWLFKESLIPAEGKRSFTAYFGLKVHYSKRKTLMKKLLLLLINISLAKNLMLMKWMILFIYKCKDILKHLVNWREGLQVQLFLDFNAKNYDFEASRGDWHFWWW